MKKPKIKKWNEKSFKQNETFKIKKITGKYICSITEIKDSKKNSNKTSKNQLKPSVTIKNISKEKLILTNVQSLKKNSISDNASSYGSKNLGSENSKNLSEMSLILTPMQVKLKQEKFSKSSKQIKSIRSKFGSFRQTEKRLDSSNYDRNNNHKTGFHKMNTRFSNASKDECLTEKTDLSKSDHSMFEMFQDLNIQSEENQNKKHTIFKEGNSPRLYSDDSQSIIASENSKNNQKCFLDMVNDNNDFATPFVKSKNEIKKNESESPGWKIKMQKTFEDENYKIKSELTSSELQNSIELSCDQSGGFDLMKMIDNTLLYSDNMKKKSNEKFPNFNTSYGLVLVYFLLIYRH